MTNIRLKPCKWGLCNGILVGRRCNRCGTVWS